MFTLDRHLDNEFYHLKHHETRKDFIALQSIQNLGSLVGG